MITITDLLAKNTILPALKAEDKQAALKALIQVLDIEPEQRKVVEKAVFNREEINSTGVGKGIAIPHCKVDVLKKHHAAFATLNAPLPFESIDNKPVELIFLLASPKQADGKHLNVLGRMSRLLNNNDFKKQLLNAGTREQVINIFHQKELKYHLNG